MIEKRQQEQLLGGLLNIYSKNKLPIILADFAIPLAEYALSGLLLPRRIASVILAI
jgi:hypothetical protein